MGDDGNIQKVIGFLLRFPSSRQMDNGGKFTKVHGSSIRVPFSLIVAKFWLTWIDGNSGFELCTKL